MGIFFNFNYLFILLPPLPWYSVQRVHLCKKTEEEEDTFEKEKLQRWCYSFGIINSFFFHSIPVHWDEGEKKHPPQNSNLTFLYPTDTNLRYCQFYGRAAKNKTKRRVFIFFNGVLMWCFFYDPSTSAMMTISWKFISVLLPWIFSFSLHFFLAKLTMSQNKRICCLVDVSRLVMPYTGGIIVSVLQKKKKKYIYTMLLLSAPIDTMYWIYCSRGTRKYPRLGHTIISNRLYLSLRSARSSLTLPNNTRARNVNDKIYNSDVGIGLCCIVLWCVG